MNKMGFLVGMTALGAGLTLKDAIEVGNRANYLGAERDPDYEEIMRQFVLALDDIKERR